MASTNTNFNSFLGKGWQFPPAFDPAPIRSHQARFSAPLFPGETVTVDLWRDGEVVSFEARIKDREATVIKNGKTVLG